MYIMALPPGMAKQYAKEAREGKADETSKDSATFYRHRQEIVVIGWDSDHPIGYVKKIDTKEWDSIVNKRKET
jgi:hypothetical protein